MEDKYFSFFGELEYIDVSIYLEDPDAEYFTAYGEWDIVRLGNGEFYYTKIREGE